MDTRQRELALRVGEHWPNTVPRSQTLDHIHADPHPGDRLMGLPVANHPDDASPRLELDREIGPEIGSHRKAVGIAL